MATTTTSAEQILEELESLGSENTKRLLMKNYGVKEPCFGVKIGDLKKIVKRVKVDHQLALDLYASGNYHAMYLAGLIADDARMTKGDLRRWAREAYAGSLPGATVPGVAAGNPHGWELALEWIEAKKTNVAAAGWATLSALVSVLDDADLDLGALKDLLARAEREIHGAPDAVRYQMNNFIIALGCSVKSLTRPAIAAGKRIGPVTADLGANSCQVPPIPEYIKKVQDHGTIGKKRKSAKC